ncbi:MAG: dihydroorotate dehydrogenase electron transfer subunit [Anaerolineae bacterium]
MSEQLHQVMRVARVRPEGSAGTTLVLDGALEALPGQFVMVWLPGIEERPFSLMDRNPISLTVADIGPFTHALARLQPGDRVWVRGPFGHGYALSGERHLLVGGGSGVASLALVAADARARGQEVIAALGSRTRDLLMLAWRFEELGCRVIQATDDGSAGFHGTVVAAVQDLLDQRWPSTVYACGPERMLCALAERTCALGVPAQVSLERIMKCGIGVCGNCHCGERLVCADGPVFSADCLCP